MSEKYNSSVKKIENTLSVLYIQVNIFFCSSYKLHYSSYLESWSVEKIVQIDGCFLCIAWIPSELASII